ncbi:MAG: hypothetical protein V1494_04285 [Candidatus Diapherotrites archaeon]
MGEQITNTIIRTHTFDKLYKKKKKQPKYIIKEVNEALLTLRNAEQPEKLGSKKGGPLKGFRAYELRHCANRILFSITRGNVESSIILHKVCNHKQVYGTE